MNRNISSLIEKIKSLETELEAELANKQEEFRFKFQNRKICFEEEVLEEHRRLKTALLDYIIHSRLRHVVSVPFIYPLFFAFLFLDIAVSLYQAICFPLYGIPKVRRADYLDFDRSQLAYLNILEKLNCAYCSYANGIAGFVAEVAGRTEQYWCPIKHAKRMLAIHSSYRRFMDFGDAEGYRNNLENLKKQFDKD